MDARVHKPAFSLASVAARQRALSFGNSASPPPGGHQAVDPGGTAWPPRPLHQQLCMMFSLLQRPFLPACSLGWWW